MSTSDSVAYLDSSALVKLVVDEDESGALRNRLIRFPVRVSCALARVEVIRAVRAHGTEAADRARRLLRDVALVALDEELLDIAAELHPDSVRSLDAIHVAAALKLEEVIGELMTYDLRMAEAARLVGLNVTAPGADVTQ